MLKWFWLCSLALMLCGCLENRAEFNALNLGKVNALYENGALNIMPTTCNEGECSKQSTKNQKESATFALFFFTTTCGVCKAQVPILQEIAKEFANEGVRIYAILGNAPNEQQARQYMNANAISLPLFYESQAKRFFSQIVGGIKGVPIVVIFDKEGRVKERFIGLTPKGVIKSALY